jgi:hypothetical protein
MTKPETTPCPDCQGRGFVYAFVDNEDGGHFDPALKCLRCKSAGEIPEREAAWMKRGRACMDLRRARSESLLTLSQRLGITPSQASAMEHGRADPRPLEEAWANG